MKQLTIYSSRELTDEVNRVLHDVQVEGFITMSELTGNKLKPRGSYEKDMAWSATAFVVFTEADRVKEITAALRDYADRCEVEPCLRMVVVPIEEIY